MSDLLTSAQMRAIEAATMVEGPMTGADLMDRAGREVAGRIMALWPRQQRTVVLCGPGNNGGDGYVVARCLAEAGWHVSVLALAQPGTPDARAAAAAWPGPVAALNTLSDRDLAGAPVVVDALFGTGLTRAIPPAASAALVLAQDRGCPLVTIDILSGLCADSGRVRSLDDFPGRAADMTVTFDSPRPGHMLDSGGRLTGRLEVVDIGTGPAHAALRSTLDPARLARPAAGLCKQEGGHKFDHGHLLVLGGASGQGGAARLAARAGLRVGAGLVTLSCPGVALAENAARLDAVMLRAADDPDMLARILEDVRIRAVCLGPGLGVDRAAALLPTVLAQPDRAAVLDADALTALASDPALFALLHPRCVLTPHAGEFARLFPDLAARLTAPPASGAPAFSRIDAARAAAARAGAVVLLKGAASVIATPTGTCVVHAALRDRAAPWLATAGSGDVLAGIIAGLLARRFAPLEAAETGAWLHAEAAIRFGPGLVADDLPDMLPTVFRALCP